MKNKFMWIAAVVFYLAMLSCLTDVHAKQVVNLKIGNIIFGEESISVETDKGRYTLPSHFSGMLEEATFTKLLELIQNNKGKTFPFIVEKLNQFQYIVGLEEKPLDNAMADEIVSPYKKINEIRKYSNTHQTQLTKDSKIFREDISGIWSDGIRHITIDLMYQNVIIIGNNAHNVRIAKYDKDKNYLTAFIYENGRHFITIDKTLAGWTFRKVLIGKSQFRLGMTLTSGITKADEKILEWVGELGE